jgi:transcriptional regulator with XRE-family HTH domain
MSTLALEDGRAQIVSLTVVRSLCAGGGARALRQRHGVSIGEIAAAIGSTPGVVSRWETGQTRPRASAAFHAYGEILGELLALEKLVVAPVSPRTHALRTLPV